MTQTSFSLSQTAQTSIEIEWHCLDLRYEHLRQHRAKAQQRLMLSICTHGLLTPIRVVCAPSPQQWTVIDGYGRIKAMRQLGKDGIQARICPLTADEALVLLYRAAQSRPWEPLEEATLLQELISGHQYSQAQCAQKLGKSEAWVSHRLQLLTDLPEFVASAICQGTVSHWVASRVLIPFARANSQHAQQFVAYLTLHRRSSRECRTFYEHYMQSSSPVRARMVADPDLFFKAHIHHSATQTQAQPKQQWQQQFFRIQQSLHTLNALACQLFYPQQPLSERRKLELPLNQTIAAIEQLQNTLRRFSDAQSTHDSNDTTTQTSRS